jgi:hypothetical protein
MKLGQGCFSPFDSATIRITWLCRYNSGKRCVTPWFENKEAQKPKGLQAVISNSEYEHLNPLHMCNALQVGPPTTNLPWSFHVIKRPCRKRQFFVSCQFHSKRVTKCNFKAWQIVLWVDFNKLPPESLTKAVNLGRQQWVSLVAKKTKFCQIFPSFFFEDHKKIEFFS